MPESYSHSEGNLHIYTGVTGASGTPVAYVQNVSLNLVIGWQPEPSVSGVYRDHNTGQQANLNAGICYTFDKTLQKIFQSATAVHGKFIQSSVNGTAGYVLMSGRLDSLSYNGAQGGAMLYSLAAHFNQWSAF